MTDNILKRFLEGFKEEHFIRVGSKKHNLFIGKDDEGRYCFEYRGAFSPVKIIGSKPLVVNQYKTDDDIFILRFSLDYNDLIGCFSAFCEDLTTSVDDISDENVVYKTLATRYQAWKKLFKPDRIGMSEPEIQGLIGELLFMRDYAIPHWGIDNALDSWTGPEKTHKDFSYKDEWFEIKTITAGKDTVRISSIEQLDSNVDGTLFIYSLEKMSPSFNGVKLNDLITELLTTFSIAQKDALLNKLVLFGFDFNTAYDNYVYAITDLSAYLVNKEFPRLERDKVPLPISKALYDIIISELTPYKIQTDCVWN